MQITTRTYPSTATIAGSLRARHRVLSLAACALVALAAPGAASAADTVIAPDMGADEVAALDGTVVWSSGTFGHQVLMERTPGGMIARVKGAPTASAYHTIDLGHDRKGRLVLTYQRCRSSSCKSFLDNLAGTRATYRHLALKRCTLSTAPAVWRTGLAYGLACRKSNKQIDDKRSGLYVKIGTRAPRRLSLPKDAIKFGISNIDAVDLRGTRAAGVAADIYEYAFTETVTNGGLRSIFAAASEGESDEHTTGVSLGSGGAMWTLTDSSHTGDPNEALIFKVTGSCYQLERLVNPAGPNQEDGYLATDLAVDRSTVYLVVPGTGIVTHPFAPEATCTPL